MHFIFISNARAKKFSSEILNLILSIPTAPSLYELEEILQALEQVEEKKVKGMSLLSTYFL
jgi:hypothetical protein